MMGAEAFEKVAAGGRWEREEGGKMLQVLCCLGLGGGGRGYGGTGPRGICGPHRRFVGGKLMHKESSEGSL